MNSLLKYPWIGLELFKVEFESVIMRYWNGFVCMDESVAR